MTKLPLDVLHYFIEFIDYPKDLLSLALAARALYALIVPRHIEYRRISCRRSSKHLWEHLLDTPYDACSRIRYLNISRSRGRTKIPRACIAKPEWNFRSPPSRGHDTRDDDPDATFEAFIQALSKMVNLKAFKFEVGDERELSLIVKAIGEAGCVLEELGAFYNCSNTSLDRSIQKADDPKEFLLFYDHLPSLRKCIISAQYDVRLLQMILNAPNLTHINVRLNHSHCHAFISGYWPNLQQLRLCCRSPMPPTNEDYIFLLQKFLHRHSKLIVLSSNILHPGWAVESDDFLPSLTSFYVKKYSQSPTITANIAARLVHLEMNCLLYLYLSRNGIILSNLKTCVFWEAERFTHQLAMIVPNIHNLCITFGLLWDQNTKRERQHINPDEVMKHVSFYANFKNLRVLIGPFRNTRMDNHLLCKALYEFPRLLYTEVRLDNGELKFCRLKRDDIAKVMIYEYETTGIPEECDVSSWDSLYSL